MDRDLVGVHALLNGWQAYHYVTSFDQVDGWVLGHKSHGFFLTLDEDKGVWRHTKQRPGSTEIDMGAISENAFWRLADRIVILNLLSCLDGHTPVQAREYCVIND